MRPPGVVPVNPLRQFIASLGEAAEVVLPGALLFQAPEEALDKAILLRRVRRNEFLPQTVVTAGGTVAPALEDKAVVAPEQRRLTLRSQRPEATDACFLEGALGLLGSPSERKLVADDFPVVAVDDDGEVGPPIPSAWDVGDVRRPRPHGTWVMSVAHRTSLRSAILMRPCTLGRGVQMR